MKKIFPILKNLNILYAEDDENIRASTQKTLELLFDNVYVAKDGAQALELFSSEFIHIVLLDYVMPKKDGYQVAKEIRKHNKHLSIIISSGYSEKDKLLNAIELHLVKYLIKPVQYDQLSEVFEEAIEILSDNNMLITPISEGMRYDYVNKRLMVEENKVILTKQEIKFIELLLEKRGLIVSKSEVERTVFDDNVETNTLRNMVYRLRKKIGKNLVVTVKDSGYYIQ
jgi:DNA-binding response OmpR family regulator